MWSFIDGPVTANKSLAVHTAWGRTLKDVFQRYKALRGFDQRYQNGFDCQGLWIEVGVERELGLNSKREIEEYGLEEFARRCREVVVRSSEDLTRGCQRLGQWMDWGNDYFTFSDTNIEYIWKFLKIVNERGWLYMGHRSTEWCPRCGTSLSQHELTQAGVYQDRADPSLSVRFPLLDRPGQSVVVWTTTPWTLPANVAAAVNPDGRLRAARERRVGRGAAVPRRHVRRARQGLGARRPALPRAVRRPEAGLGGRAPRDPVGRRDDGPGHRCRPHRPGRRRRGLRALEGARPARADAGRRVRPVLRRLRLAARRLDDRVGRPDHRRARREGHPRRVDPLHARLPALLALRHAAHLPALRRLVHLGRGDPPEAARGERQGAVGARVHGEAHGRLAAQHGRLEHLAAPLLRAAAAVLSVLMRSSERRRLEARARRARDGGLRRARGAAPPVGRPCADHVRVVRRGRDARARGRGRLARRRHRPVLDARLGEPRVDQGGVRDRCRARADARRPARPQLLGEVVPRRLGDGDARADPALVLLAVLHVGRARRHARRTSACSATRRCSTSTAARCTAPGGT